MNTQNKFPFHIRFLIWIEQTFCKHEWENNPKGQSYAWKICNKCLKMKHNG